LTTAPAEGIYIRNKVFSAILAVQCGIYDLVRLVRIIKSTTFVKEELLIRFQQQLLIVQYENYVT